MSNIFDSTQWPSYPPNPFVAGDYFAFKRTDLSGQYPLASYAVTFNASLFGSGTGTTSSSQISLTATESGSEYQLTAAASATASWTVGDYAWNLFVGDGTNRQRLDHGTFEVRPNWVTSTADPRSDAQKNLELIENVLYGWVQGDVSSYSIAGRSLSKMSPKK